jgi:predicted Zn-dependent protease
MKKSFLFAAFLGLCLYKGLLAQGGSDGSGPIDMNAVSGALSQMDSAIANSDDELSPEDAYYLGRAVAANVLARYRPYTQKPALTRYVNEICSALVVNASLPLLYNGCHVMILDSPELNAITSSGGHIFLFRGLVEAARSEDELAAVLAHELAHLTLRHSAEAINRLRLTQRLSTVAEQGAAVAAGRVPVQEQSRIMGTLVTAYIDELFERQYSLEQEYAADTEALALLRAAGYAPASLHAVLTMLQAGGGAGGGGHPLTAARIDRVRVADREQDTRSARTARFAEAYR